MDVRRCEPPDVPLLDEAMPIPGEFGHRYRLEGQRQGRWDYLVAFAPKPVGACLVHWAGPTDQLVRAALPECAEITSLYVIADSRRRGAGRALLANAEVAALERDRPMLGVGVDDGNGQARRLYESLGYRPSGRRFEVSYDYADDSGAVTSATEAGDFLIKILGSTHS